MFDQIEAIHPRDALATSSATARSFLGLRHITQSSLKNHGEASSASPWWCNLQSLSPTDLRMQRFQGWVELAPRGVPALVGKQIVRGGVNALRDFDAYGTGFVEVCPVTRADARHQR